jgi:hypothetical protein
MIISKIPLTILVREVRRITETGKRSFQGGAKPAVGLSA